MQKLIISMAALALLGVALAGCDKKDGAITATTLSSMAGIPIFNISFILLYLPLSKSQQFCSFSEPERHFPYKNSDSQSGDASEVFPLHCILL